MGQYFNLVNATKKQFIDPHKCGNGLKMGECTGWEHSVQTIGKLLMSPPRDEHPMIGAWAGDEVFFAGDYGSTYDIDLKELPGDGGERYFALEDDDGNPSSGWEDVSYKACDMMSAIYGIKYSGNGWRKITETKGSKASPPLRPDIILAKEQK